MTLKDAREQLAAIRKDHVSLDRDIAEWREWWGELCEIGRPHFGEMGDRLAQFRDHLAAHFAYEESEGLLSDQALAEHHLAERIRELRAEHVTLLAELDALITRLRAPEPDFTGWGRARDEFEEFLDKLNMHEDTEEALLADLI